MNNEIYRESWWLMYCSFPNLNWARLRVFPSARATVFDSDGTTHSFETEQDAVFWLHEDEFTERSNMDSEDEIEFEINLAEIMPPEGASDEELKDKMFVTAKVN